MSGDALDVGIELLAGTYDAQRARDHDNLTAALAMEWPPSPARLVAALVAVAYRSGRTDLLDALDRLCSFDPPIIYASKAAAASFPDRYASRTHKERWGGYEKYLKEVSRSRSPEGWHVDRWRHVESFCAVPDNRRVRFVWHHPDVGPVRPALDFLCSRLSYLGRPSSQVAAWVSETDADVALDGVYRWKPCAASGKHPSELAVPYSGFLAAIEQNRLARVPFPVSASYKERRRYRMEHSDDPVRSPWCTHEWVIRGRRLQPGDTVPFAQAVRSQSLALCGTLPPSVTGHGADGVPHVGWWPVITATSQRLVVGVPGPLACPPIPGSVDFNGSELSLSRAAIPLVWSDQTSRTWASVTAIPLIGSSDARRQKNLDKQLRQAGLPSAREMFFSRSPVVRGSLPAASYRLSRTGERPRAPGAHVLMRFDEPVKGLFAVGDLRYFGSGLMVPIDDIEDPS